MVGHPPRDRRRAASRLRDRRRGRIARIEDHPHRVPAGDRRPQLASAPAVFKNQGVEKGLVARRGLRPAIAEHSLELVDRLPGRKVVLVGDLMLDQYIYGDAERLSPDAPVPVLRFRKEDARLGGAGRVDTCNV